MSLRQRMWVGVAVLVFGSTFLAQAQMTVRVLQSKHVPNKVVASQGIVAASCSIRTTMNSAGTEPDSGRDKESSAIPARGLSMDCNSDHLPSDPAHHLMDTALVKASNGMAYIISCKATWPWSKCGTLTPGSIYRAKLVRNEIIVEYMDNGTLTKSTYRIWQEKDAR